MSNLHRITVPLMAAVCFIGSSADVCFGVTIRFHSQAKVTGPFIRLGDVASVTDAAPEVLSRYQEIRLASSPPPGGQCVLDFDSVRNCLLASGYSSGELEFTGQSRTLVTTAISVSTENADRDRKPAIRQVSYETGAENQTRAQARRILLNALRNELKSSLDPGELALAEIEIQVGDAEAAEIAGSAFSDWKIEGWSQSLEQPHDLTFTKKPPEPGHHPLSVGCRIKLPPKAFIVNNHLPVGHTITPADVTWTYSKQVAEEISLDQIVGMETKHALRPGSPIQLSDLRIKPYVRTRDLVTVKARQGGIVVKRTMRSLGTGGLGEPVELVTLDGKDRFTAKVTGYHETEVLESQTGASP